MRFYHEPVTVPEQPLGLGYRSTKIYLPDETVSPLVKPDTQVKVVDLQH
ncbi:MAG: hypothetical protein RMK89_13615 [Armatimonadota bacterium]|nr:hypothetical protein [Armatimonadota bacterium]MDW8144485.1 hypothetical protein [Armatimonadota bacterium]